MDPSWDWNQWWMNRGHYHDMYSLFTILGEPWKFTNPNCIGPFWEGFPYINQTFIMWLGGLGRLVVCPDYSGGTWISSSFFKVTSSINHFSRGLSHLQLGNQSRSLWITWWLCYSGWSQFFILKMALNEKLKKQNASPLRCFSVNKSWYTSHVFMTTRPY